MKVLIATPRLGLQGGVANYYRILRPHLDAEKVFFEIGAQVGESGALTAIFRLLADSWAFHRTLSEESWDLVHTNPSMVGGSILRDGILMLIARAHRKRVLVFFHGWDTACADGINRRFAWLFRLVYSQAAAFIVLGAEFKAALASMVVNRPTFIATTVVDDGFAQMAMRDVPPAEPAGACRILFLCRLDVGKGLPESIEAFERIQSRWPAATLTVVGDGLERAPAEARVAVRGLKGVRFLGHIDGAEKAALFHNSDIYFLPTWLMEGMPASLLEAMTCGLPVITRPVGGIRDFFEDGRMGYITESRDPAVYAELLDRLIGNPRLRLQMGEYNREYARTHFSSTVVVNALLDVYAQVGREC